MTLGDLIGHLEELVELGFDEDKTEVRLAIQPSYPFQHGIDRVTALDAVTLEVDEKIVYIAESGQISEAPYLPQAVKEELGW